MTNSLYGQAKLTIAEIIEKASLKKGDILFNGHTHVSKIEELPDGVIYANPGSVSIPKENTPRGYMIVDEKSVIHKTLDGEMVEMYSL